MVEKVSTDDTDTTHFGFKTVAKDQKEHLVRGVFDSVASRYDLMNDLMSAGIHRFWKRFTIELSAVRPGQTVLDIAGGTGDLAAKFSQLVGSEGRVILSDINNNMLRVGRDRLIDSGAVGNLHTMQCDAQYLPFPDESIDCITIAFGLRNVTDKDRALAEMERVLKPGGRLLVLEFSKPTHPLLEKAYDAYSFRVVAKTAVHVALEGAAFVHETQDVVATQRRHRPANQRAVDGP